MYRYLEHTADVIIEAEGKNIEEAFEEAAKAISDFMVFREKVENKEKKEIEIEAETLEDLLVDFLTELLGYLDSEMFIWNDVKVKIEKNSKYKLKAEVYGEKYDEKKHGYKGYIKAITYHQLKIENNKVRFLIDI